MLQTLHDNTPDEELTTDFQAMMLKEDEDKQDPSDSQTDKVEVTDDNKKEEEEGQKSPKVEYIMRQEKVQQEEEEKYNIYMSNFSYEGDDSDLDSETDSESEGQAYPFLD